MLKRLLLAALLATVPACSREAPDSQSAKARTPEKAHPVQAEAWEAIRGGALLVDVRTESEFEQGHLDGALLIPHDEIASRAGELGPDKERTIVLYCRTGNRSGRAKRALEELGYTHVLNAGGYESMRRAQ